MFVGHMITPVFVNRESQLPGIAKDKIGMKFFTIKHNNERNTYTYFRKKQTNLFGSLRF